MLSSDRKDRMRAYLGKTVPIRVSRRLIQNGSALPFPVCAGFLPGVTGGDGGKQGVYLLGADSPAQVYTAQVIGIVYHENGTADKLIAAPEGMCFHQAQIAEAVHFQERCFQNRVEAVYHRSCGAVIFRRNGGQIEYLCLRQIPSGTYSVPKGHMEAFESEEETARREIREETGLSLRFAPGFREEMHYELCDDIHIDKTVVLFLAEYSGAPLALRPGEISAYEWLELPHAKQTLPVPYSGVLDRAEQYLNA